MKPLQIRVFDGLRITTDHVNHLQGAFYSGLEDFREILGLGRAHVGLEVAAQDDTSINIQPGVAFDFEKNRVPVDSVQTVKLDFASADDVKYICLQHTEVDDGAVEGHPTIIWDNSAVLVRPAAPDPKENLVLLARVAKTADGKLHVCQAERGYRHKEAFDHKDQAPGPPAPGPGEPPPSGSAPPPGPNPPSPASAPAEPPPSGGAPPPGSNPPSPEPVAAQAAPQPAAPVAAAPAFQIRQDVLQLTSDPGANLLLKTTLAPALRQKMGANPIALSFALAQAGLNPDIAVAGFSTHCFLSGDLTFPSPQGAAPQHYRFQSAASGEATVAAGALAQFAMCTFEASPVPPGPGLLWSAHDFTGQALAHVAFAQWLNAPEAGRPPLAAEILGALELAVQLDRTSNGFQIALKLLWNGTASEGSVSSLETQDLGFTWSLFFGWKAIGS